MADQQKGILLPNRTTRGNRYRKLVQDDDIDDEQQEDKEFWQQEFFKDEERDDEYLTESEPSDIFESDFLDTVCGHPAAAIYELHHLHEIVHTLHRKMTRRKRGQQMRMTAGHGMHAFPFP